MCTAFLTKERQTLVDRHLGMFLPGNGGKIHDNSNNIYLSKSEIEKKIREIRKAMENAAKSLDFIEAAKFRDEIKILQDQL